MTELLLGLIGGLIATQTLVVKWLMSRNEAQQKDSDRTTKELIGHLSRAVDSFKSFEREETDTHSAILETLAGIANTQERILVLLTRSTKAQAEG